MSSSAGVAEWPAMYEAQGRVLRDLIVHGDRSSIHFARRLDMSRATFSRVTKELIALGFVEEGEVRHGARRSRPSETMRVTPGAAVFPWAFDEEAVEVTRRFTHLPMRLIPYLYAAGVTAT